MKLRRVLETKGRNDVFTIPLEGNVSDFVRAAVKRGVGAMIVVDQGRMCGIITERDILRHVERKTDFDHTPIGLIMTREVISAQVDDDVVTAMDLIIKGKMRHLPVMDGMNIAGMVTVRDLIGALRHSTEAELQETMEGLKKQPKTSWGDTIH